MEKGYVTKKALSLGLKELMKKVALDKIRVNQITEITGVSRNTFYYHFSDINELLSWTYDHEVVFSLESYTQLDSWQAGLMKVLDYTENNRGFCMNTFHSLSRDRLENFLYRITYDMLQTMMMIDLQEKLDGNLRHEIADFYGRALVAQVIHWLLTNLRESKEGLVNRVERMTVGAIERVVTYCKIS